MTEDTKLDDQPEDARFSPFDGEHTYDPKDRPIDPNERFGIGRAVHELKLGNCVSREGWNGRRMYLALQLADDNTENTEDYVYMITNNQVHRVPWLASQTDLLADDYLVVPRSDNEPGNLA